MANTKSAEKRIRSTAVRRLRNRYLLTTTRTFLKRIRHSKDVKEASEMLPKVASMIDRCVKSSIFHKNKGSNLKSKISRHVNALHKA